MAGVEVNDRRRRVFGDALGSSSKDIVIKKTIYVFRHGAVEERYRKCFRGQLDCALSQEGERSSDAMAFVLLDEHAQVVVTTGLLRTDVVGEIGAGLGILHIVDERFCEADFGDWQTKTWSEIEAKCPRDAAAYLQDPDSFAFPGGEAMADVRARVAAAWEDLLERDAERIGLVAHSLVIACLCANLRAQRVMEAEALEPSELLKITIDGPDRRIERVRYDRSTR
jgi:broad specificity phosphatase PhoE